MLSSTRGDLPVILNDDEISSISASVKEVDQALHAAIIDTGVRTEGESEMLARKLERDRAGHDNDEEASQRRDVDELEDDMGNFELDL